MYQRKYLLIHHPKLNLCRAADYSRQHLQMKTVQLNIKFHEAVQQQISGEVAGFMSAFSAVYDVSERIITIGHLPKLL